MTQGNPQSDPSVPPNRQINNLRLCGAADISEKSPRHKYTVLKSELRNYVRHGERERVRERQTFRDIGLLEVRAKNFTSPIPSYA